MVAITPGEAAVMTPRELLGARGAPEQLALGGGLAEIGVGDLGHGLGASF